MKIRPLRKDLVNYLSAHNLSKKWKKVTLYFEENINHRSLNTELLEPHIRSWYEIVRNENWTSFNEIKSQFRNASIVGNDRVVFYIKGNSYRLVVKVDFNWKVMFIRFIGTHNEYDKLNVKKL
ncbi:MAG: type II toxin-antitoxin system HigB family toxin [Ignavibacteria bacterium]|nr:type II toxin-antitoxin system HigB family toxin [Ignavibacteria bacterium]